MPLIPLDIPIASWMNYTQARQIRPIRFNSRTFVLLWGYLISLSLSTVRQSKSKCKPEIAEGWVWGHIWWHCLSPRSSHAWNQMAPWMSQWSQLWSQYRPLLLEPVWVRYSITWTKGVLTDLLFAFPCKTCFCIPGMCLSLAHGIHSINISAVSWF